MSTTIKTERTDVKCQQGVLCVWYNVHTRLDGIEFCFFISFTILCIQLNLLWFVQLLDLRNFQIFKANAI
jgi:hypothetical protein